jgi:hypothetical protein
MLFYSGLDEVHVNKNLKWDLTLDSPCNYWVHCCYFINEDTEGEVVSWQHPVIKDLAEIWLKWRAGGVAQVAEWLPNKSKALNSNPSTAPLTPKTNKQKRLKWMPFTPNLSIWNYRVSYFRITLKIIQKLLCNTKNYS